MIGHFPACPKCNSLDVMYTCWCGREHAYHCCSCDHDTPERDSRREADADVQWLPATVGTPDDPVEAAA